MDHAEFLRRVKSHIKTPTKEMEQQLEEFCHVCSYVSGQYDDLDTDHGTYLYYSANNSHSNDDPHRAVESSPGALALHQSRLSGKPVRVLRSSTGKSQYAPRCGLRYDGLYRVVTVNHPKNAKGGLYEQFGLERLGGQAEIDVLRPNAREESRAR